MNKKEQLKKELKALADQINYNMQNLLPTAKLKGEFYKKSLKYKRLWLIERDNLHTLYKGRLISK